MTSNKEKKKENRDEDVREERYMRTIGKCPEFKGEISEYKRWKVRLSDWRILYEEYVKYPGIVVRQEISGKAFEAVENISMECLKEKDGIDTIIKYLDKAYMGDQVGERLEVAKKFFNLKRKIEMKETVREYAMRHRKAREEWKKLEGKTDELEGLMLLNNCMISDSDYHVIMGACGESRDYDSVHNKLVSIFGGRIDRGKKENSWMGDEREGCFKCGAMDHWAYQCKKEKVCFKCNKEGHFARECNVMKDNKKDKKEIICFKCQKPGHISRLCDVKNGRLEQGNIERKEYGWAAKGREEELCDRIRAIIDPGCPSSVVGDI